MNQNRDILLTYKISRALAFSLWIISSTFSFASIFNIAFGLFAIGCAFYILPKELIRGHGDWDKESRK